MNQWISSRCVTHVEWAWPNILKASRAAMQYNITALWYCPSYRKFRSALTRLGGADAIVGYCREIILCVKDLSMVSTWRLEWDSILLRPSRRKTSNPPLSHQTPILAILVLRKYFVCVKNSVYSQAVLIIYSGRWRAFLFRDRFHWTNSYTQFSRVSASSVWNSISAVDRRGSHWSED